MNSNRIISPYSKEFTKRIAKIQYLRQEQEKNLSKDPISSRNNGSSYLSTSNHPRFPSSERLQRNSSNTSVNSITSSFSRDLQISRNLEAWENQRIILARLKQEASRKDELNQRTGKQPWIPNSNRILEEANSIMTINNKSKLIQDKVLLNKAWRKAAWPGLIKNNPVPGRRSVSAGRMYRVTTTSLSQRNVSDIAVAIRIIDLSDRYSGSHGILMAKKGWSRTELLVAIEKQFGLFGRVSDLCLVTSSSRYTSANTISNRNNSNDSSNNNRNSNNSNNSSISSISSNREVRSLSRGTIPDFPDLTDAIEVVVYVNGALFMNTGEERRKEVDQMLVDLRRQHHRFSSNSHQTGRGGPEVEVEMMGLPSPHIDGRQEIIDHMSDIVYSPLPPNPIIDGGEVSSPNRTRKRQTTLLVQQIQQAGVDPTLLGRLDSWDHQQIHQMEEGEGEGRGCEIELKSIGLKMSFSSDILDNNSSTILIEHLLPFEVEVEKDRINNSTTSNSNSSNNNNNNKMEKGSDYMFHDENYQTLHRHYEEEEDRLGNISRTHKHSSSVVFLDLDDILHNTS